MNRKQLIEDLRVINRKVSYEKIARELNVSSKSVYRWLKGITFPQPLALEKIAKYIKKTSK